MDSRLTWYVERHSLDLRGRIGAPPAADLAIVVVVPARAEGDISALLHSLGNCSRAPGAVEVIVVVNAHDSDGEDIRRRNAETVDCVQGWAAKLTGSSLRGHVLVEEAVPRRHAGVGTARKLGLDEGALRLARAGALDAGVLLSLDADCTVAPNYLTAVHDRFAHPKTRVATVYYEHQLPCDQAQRRALVDYELHLRVYVNGLRAAAAPLAHHTVGSCMAVRAGTYIELGGMNRRQAGEDFYFLNKADQRFALTEIGATTVYPAARLSARTPFGTGRALSLAAHVGAGSLEVYDPRCYLGVGQVLAGLDSLYGYDGVLDPSKPPEALFAEALGYLESVHWRTVLDEIADQVSSQHAYRKRLRVWFDGFRTMKLIHWLTRKCFPRVAVGSAALEVLGWHEPLGVPRDATNFQLLQRFRGLDRAYAVPSANVG